MAARDAALGKTARVVAKRDWILSERDLEITIQDQAWSDRDWALSKRDRALAVKSKALELRDVVVSLRDHALAERDQVLAERRQALEIKDLAMSEREKAVQELEELQGKFHKLCRQLTHYKARATRLASQLAKCHGLGTQHFQWASTRVLKILGPWPEELLSSASHLRL